MEAEPRSMTCSLRFVENERLTRFRKGKGAIRPRSRQTLLGETRMHRRTGTTLVAIGLIASSAYAQQPATFRAKAPELRRHIAGTLSGAAPASEQV
jgi:hypothetical protein